MSSIVRDHSDHVQLFIDSLGVKGEYRRTLKKAVKTVLGEKSANDREFLNSLLENPAILGSLEKYCLYDKDVFVTFIIFREEPLLLKANILMSLEKVEEARDVFLMVLGNDDTCADALEGLKNCEETIEEDGIMTAFRDLFI